MNINSNLNNINDLIKELQVNYQNLKKENEKNETDKINANNQIEELKEKYKILEKTNEKNEKDKIIANNQIEELKVQNKILKEEIEKINAKYESLEKKLESFLQSGKNTENANKAPKNIAEQKHQKKDKTKEKNKNKSLKIEEKNIVQDDYYPNIERKLKQKIKLLQKEEIYLKVYEKCKEELKVDNFSLSQYSKDHTSQKASTVTKSFHTALKTLNQKDRKIFFESFGFKQCMSDCWSLLNE